MPAARPQTTSVANTKDALIITPRLYAAVAKSHNLHTVPANSLTLPIVLYEGFYITPTTHPAISPPTNHHWLYDASSIKIYANLPICAALPHATSHHVPDRRDDHKTLLYILQYFYQIQ